jgi:hypothetical protein
MGRQRQMRRLNCGYETRAVQRNVERFLHHLIADTRAAVSQRGAHQPLGNSVFGAIGLVQVVDEDVGVDKRLSARWLVRGCA